MKIKRFVDMKWSISNRETAFPGTCMIGAPFLEIYSRLYRAKKSASTFLLPEKKSIWWGASIFGRPCPTSDLFRVWRWQMIAGGARRRILIFKDIIDISCYLVLFLSSSRWNSFSTSTIYSGLFSDINIRFESFSTIEVFLRLSMIYSSHKSSARRSRRNVMISLDLLTVC
jgi:hypothetical protein